MRRLVIAVLSAAALTAAFVPATFAPAAVKHGLPTG